eukprot:5420870-Alexandrium_andersonii.AAC.1
MGELEQRSGVLPTFARAYKAWLGLRRRQLRRPRSPASLSSPPLRAQVPISRSRRSVLPRARSVSQ